MPANLHLLRTLAVAGLLSVPLPVPAADFAFEEECAIPPPARAARAPRSTQEELLVTSRKLAWVGNQLLQKGRFEEAALNLRDAFNVLVAMEEVPPVDMARLTNIIGFTYTMLGDYLNARPAFELALEYLPGSDPELAAKRPPVLLNYVEYLLRTGEWKQARLHLDEAIALQERHDIPEAQRAPAYITRGELELISGNPAAASTWLERADRALTDAPDTDPRHHVALLTALRESYQLQGRGEAELQAGQRIQELQARIRTAAESP